MARRSTPLPPTSFRKPRDLTFRKSDVTRAFKAAEAAGIANPRIEIDRNGVISITTAGDPLPIDVKGNEWDNVQ